MIASATHRRRQDRAGSTRSIHPTRIHSPAIFGATAGACGAREVRNPSENSHVREAATSSSVGTDALGGIQTRPFWLDRLGTGHMCNCETHHFKVKEINHEISIGSLHSPW